MVKLDDVAKLAGVSKGTASRVLNNRGYISQQTRERIEAAVKELNYYPNENARNLLKRRSGMIGVVVPTITYPYYSEMISFLEKFLKASGYKILLCNTSFSSGASQDYIKLLNNNRVDGAIIFNYKLPNRTTPASPSRSSLLTAISATRRRMLPPTMCRAAHWPPIVCCAAAAGT